MKLSVLKCSRWFRNLVHSTELDTVPHKHCAPLTLQLWDKQCASLARRISSTEFNWQFLPNLDSCSSGVPQYNVFTSSKCKCAVSALPVCMSEFQFNTAVFTEMWTQLLQPGCIWTYLAIICFFSLTRWLAQSNSSPALFSFFMIICNFGHCQMV